MYAPNVAISILPSVPYNKASPPVARAPSQLQTAEVPMVSTASHTHPSTNPFQSHCRKGNLDCPQSRRKCVLGGLSSIKRRKMLGWRGTPWIWMSTTTPPRAAVGGLYLVLYTSHIFISSSTFTPLPWSTTLIRLVYESFLFLSLRGGIEPRQTPPRSPGPISLLPFFFLSSRSL